MSDAITSVPEFCSWLTNPMRGEKMSKTTKIAKAKVMKLIAAIGKKSALIGYYSASILGFHQLKEHVNLREKLNKK